MAVDDVAETLTPVAGDGALAASAGPANAERSTQLENRIATTRRDTALMRATLLVGKRPGWADQ